MNQQFDISMKCDLLHNKSNNKLYQKAVTENNS